MQETVRFDIPECRPEQVELLSRRLGVSRALAQVLVRRGHAEEASARAFLAADECHDPSAFAGMERVVAGLLAAVGRGARITIHGDYDVDGICATAVMVRCLRSLGGDVDWYLPDRIADGYGLGGRTVERLAARGTELLLTVDCAVTAVEEVALARGLGMEVVVTDHHMPRADGAVPDCAILHPSLCGYPCPDLCGTGVAHKLAVALAGAAGGSQDPLADLDLVALATIADMVPLLGENRRLAREGLRAVATTCKPGLRALMNVARIDASRVDERAVGFSLAPRLNAAGRLYRADAGLELLLTGDPLRAAQVAEELDRANQERRRTEQVIRHEAEAQIALLAEGQPGRSSYVLAGQGWHPGVIGIVASRLAERHNRPVVLVALEGERGRGSGRSIEGFDLLAGLRACSPHLARYGGHRAAAGVEIETARLADFAQALEAHAQWELQRMDLAPRERVDAIVEGPELGMALAEELAMIAPHGVGNPPVSLLLREAYFSDARAMGEGRHLRCTIEAGGARSRAVRFGAGSALPAPAGVPAEATFTLEVNEYRGVSEPRLVLRRVRPMPEPARPALRLVEGPEPGLVAPAAVDRPQEPAPLETPAGELVLF